MANVCILGAANSGIPPELEVDMWTSLFVHIVHTLTALEVCMYVSFDIHNA